MSNKVQNPNVKINKAIKFGLYFVLFLPLFFTNFTFFPWMYGKTIIFQIIVEVLVFFWLYNCLSSRAPSSERVNSVKESFGRFNWLDWSILVFLFILIITAFIGVNPQNSFWGNQARASGVFTWLHFGVFYFLLKSYLVEYPTEKHNLFRVMVGVGLLAALSATFQNYLPPSWRGDFGPRYSGIIGNPAFLATYLLPVFGIAIFCLMEEIKQNKGWYKNFWFWFNILAVGLVGTTLLGTQIRGTFIGLIAGIISALVISLFVWSNKKICLIFGAVLVAVCLLLGFLFIFRQSDNLKNQLPQLTTLLNLDYTVGTGDTRLMAWQEALKGLENKPILGWGWGNYEIIFNKYYNPQFLKYSFKETVWDKPHNWFLEVVDATGIFGALIYLGIFVAAFYLLMSKRGLFSPPEKIILGGVLIGYFVQNLFLFETTNTTILWFVILAYISASQHSASVESVFSNRHKIINSLIFCFLLVVFCFSLYQFNFLPLKASYYMRQADLSSALTEWLPLAQKALAVPVPFKPENAIFLAQQLTNFDKAGVIVNSKGFQDTAIEIANILNESSQKYSDNLALPSWAGQIYMVLGEIIDAKYYSDAERILQKAVHISPRKQETLFLLGRLYLLEKNFDKAIETQQKAIEAAPEMGVSHWFSGLSYVAADRRAEGLKEVEKAQELGYTLKADEKLYVLDLYALEKNYFKLVEEYKKLINVDPGNINWYVKLATVYAVAGNKKAALETVNYAIGMFPPIKAEADKFIKQYQLDKP